MNNSEQSTLPAEHVHQWHANGLMRENRVLSSPCSELDDWLYTSVLSVQVCSCGEVRRVKVGEENGRRRGDELRRRR